MITLCISYQLYRTTDKSIKGKIYKQKLSILFKKEFKCYIQRVLFIEQNLETSAHCAASQPPQSMLAYGLSMHRGALLPR